MNKTKKIIIAFSVMLVIAASVLVVTLIRVSQDEKEGSSSSVVYTLRPTTTTSVGVGNTDSWVDINQIAGNLTTSDPSLTSTDTSSTTMPVQIPNNVTQIVYVDMYGNIVDPNNVNQNQGGNNSGNDGGDSNKETKTTTTKIDSTEAFDEPVDEGNQMDEFEINKDGIITGYYGDSNNVIIPVRTQGKAVKGIGANCFKDSKIVSVYIPDTVTSIGNSAFENCSTLSSVTFASNVTKVDIGANAFKNCIALKEMNLPACPTVGLTAFDNCTALKKIIFSRGTESIGSYCFSNCRSLESVYMPNSVTTFGTNVFDGCNQEKMKVFTPLGSDAETYAQNAGFKTAEY